MVPAYKATVLALILSVFLAGRTRAATDKSSTSTSAHAIATAQFGAFALPEQRNTQVHSTLAFISDDTLALLLCPPNLASNCQLVVLQLSGGHIQLLAHKADFHSGTVLFRSSEGLVLDPNVYGQPTRLYSRDLNTDGQISDQGSISVRISLSGGTIAVWTKPSGSLQDSHWTIYRVRFSPSPVVEKIKEVAGHLQDVADDLLVMRVGDTIQTETMDGKVVGSFQVKPRSKAETDVEFAGKERLYVATWHHDRIVDLNGKELVKLRAPDGWGFRHGWSTDGSRLLFDHYTRKVPLPRSVGEDILLMGTLGVGAVDQDDNGEAIRVLDTVTGKTCFDWKDPKHLIDAGRYHADISPDGKLVAVVVGGTLTIYALPDSCGKN